MKVQFNCRLDEGVAEWIMTEAALKTVELKRRVSQGEVVEMLVGKVDKAAKSEAAPAKREKRVEQKVESAPVELPKAVEQVGPLVFRRDK